MKFYAYSGCGTCRNALKWMKAQGLEVEPLPIREQPPTVEELEYVLEAKGGALKTLFSTSGQTYKEMDLKTKLPALTKKEAIELLRSNGNLVKRPFVVDKARGVALVGFKEEEWAKAFIK